MNLGKAIKILRDKNGINQNQFSKKITITQQQLSLIENNHVWPSLKSLETISKALGVPVPTIFWFAMEEADVPKKKRDTFIAMKASLDDTILSLSK